MQSCIYEGWVRHRRFVPVEHQFRYRMFMMYLDLDEVLEVFRGRWFWSATRRALARFRREDHFGDPSEPLKESVFRLLREHDVAVPNGPVRLLTHLRYFGYVFNPVSFYFCFDDGERLQSVVAEVNNTPWGERHTYILEAKHFGNGPEPKLLPKQFHVSPFMSMDQSYRWKLKSPSQRLTMHMENLREQDPIFDVTMQLTRQEITGMNLMKQLVRFPLMTQKVIASIYWEAFKLWWKGCPYVPHPSRASAVS